MTATVSLTALLSDAGFRRSVESGLPEPLLDQTKLEPLRTPRYDLPCLLDARRVEDREEARFITYLIIDVG